jgi:hypothetical protein
MAAQLKRILKLNSSGADVDAEVVKEKNAQIGDNFSVEGVTVYQDANGAPVEQVSPLGYHVGWYGILFLNVSQMVGTGVFSTRKFSFPAYLYYTDEHAAGSILRSLDSVGMSMMYWFFGAIIAAGLYSTCP